MKCIAKELLIGNMKFFVIIMWYVTSTEQSALQPVCHLSLTEKKHIISNVVADTNENYALQKNCSLLT